MPNPTFQSLADKTLVMIVGPSAIGKSTLMERITELDNEFGYVNSFTTRTKRPSEKSHYMFVDRAKATEWHETNQTITYFEHPTTHDIYGTTAESYRKPFNLLDTLSGSVAMYRQLPFERTVTVSLTAPASEWREWFFSRYPIASDEALKRLKEAEESISWSLADPETHWLENAAGHVDETARKLIKMIHSSSARKDRHALPESRAMLNLIREGVY